MSFLVQVRAPAVNLLMSNYGPVFLLPSSNVIEIGSFLIALGSTVLELMTISKLIDCPERLMSSVKTRRDFYSKSSTTIDIACY